MNQTKYDEFSFKASLKTIDKKLIILLLFPITVQAQLWDSLPGVQSSYSTISISEADNKLWISRTRIDTNLAPNNFNLVTWDGSQWATVPGGVDGAARTVVKYNGDIYIGGSFANAGGPYPGSCVSLGNCIKYLAKWDGSQYFNIANFGNGQDVYRLIVYQGELFAGGMFYQIGGQNIKGLAKYNGGTSWSVVGSGLTNWNLVEILSMIEYNGDLIVAGSFNTAGGVSTLNVARWNGTNWSNMGNGLNGRTYAMCIDTATNTLYAGGNFLASPPVMLYYVAKWDGVNWVPLGNGLPYPARSIAFYKGKLYAGMNCYYNYCDTTFASWNGSTWTFIQPRPNYSIEALRVFNETLYVGGAFSRIGNDSSFRIVAKFTDTTTVISSVQNNSNVDFFKVYPNPFKNCISLRTTFKNTETEIIIRNTLGEIVYRRKEDLISNDEISIDLSSLPQGVYFFIVKQNGFSKVKKIVKM